MLFSLLFANEIIVFVLFQACDDEIIGYKGRIDDQVTCSEKLISAAEIDQDPVEKEMSAMQAKYDELRARSNEFLQKITLLKNDVDEFNFDIKSVQNVVDETGESLAVFPKPGHGLEAMENDLETLKVVFEQWVMNTRQSVHLVIG